MAEPQKNMSGALFKNDRRRDGKEDRTCGGAARSAADTSGWTRGPTRCSAGSIRARSTSRSSFGPPRSDRGASPRPAMMTSPSSAVRCVQRVRGHKAKNQVAVADSTASYPLRGADGGLKDTDRE